MTATARAESPADPRINDAARRMVALSHLSRFPHEPEELKRIAGAYLSFASLEPCQHPDLGQVVPLDWLLTAIQRHCTRFPSPAAARQIYIQRFPPLDLEPGPPLEIPLSCQDRENGYGG